MQLSWWQRISLLDPQGGEVVSKSPADPERGGGVDSSLSPSYCWAGRLGQLGDLHRLPV